MTKAAMPKSRGKGDGWKSSGQGMIREVEKR
jgi:hypothetical protein